MKLVRTALAALALALASAGAALAGTTVEMKTNVGTMTIELFDDKAPETVANFLQYVKDGFYKGTIFHRVIPGFMIQGGGFTTDFKEKPTRAPVRNEANNGLKNTLGTLAMARTGQPHSATAQFFINVNDNGFLDHRAPNPRGWGYAVFGRVVKGMEVTETILAIRTSNRGPYENVPNTDVVIEDVRIIDN